jgi:hypothetical protein
MTDLVAIARRQRTSWHPGLSNGRGLVIAPASCRDRAPTVGTGPTRLHRAPRHPERVRLQRSFVLHADIQKGSDVRPGAYESMVTVMAGPFCSEWTPSNLQICAVRVVRLRCDQPCTDGRTSTPCEPAEQWGGCSAIGRSDASPGGRIAPEGHHIGVPVISRMPEAWRSGAN